MRKSILQIARHITFHELQQKYNHFMVFIFLMLTSNTASASTPVDWFNNISRTFSPGMSMMTGGLYVIGGYFIYDGVMKMKEKPQNPQIKASAILIDWVAGAILIGFGLFGGGVREQIFGSGGSGSTAGFSTFQ